MEEKACTVFVVIMRVSNDRRRLTAVCTFICFQFPGAARPEVCLFVLSIYPLIARRDVALFKHVTLKPMCVIAPILSPSQARRLRKDSSRIDAHQINPHQVGCVRIADVATRQQTADNYKSFSNTLVGKSLSIRKLEREPEDTNRLEAGSAAPGQHKRYGQSNVQR